MKLDLTAQKLWKATPSMVQKNNYSLSHCFSGCHQIWTAIFSEIYLYRYIIIITPLEGQPVCPIVIRYLFKGAYSGSGNETTTDPEVVRWCCCEPRSSKSPALLAHLSLFVLPNFNFDLSKFLRCLFSHSPTIICIINGEHTG